MQIIWHHRPTSPHRTGSVRCLTCCLQVRIGEANSGVHQTALREIKVLQELDHPNVIKLLQVIITLMQNNRYAI